MLYVVPASDDQGEKYFYETHGTRIFFADAERAYGFLYGYVAARDGAISNQFHQKYRSKITVGIYNQPTNLYFGMTNSHSSGCNSWPISNGLLLRFLLAAARLLERRAHVFVLNGGQRISLHEDKLKSAFAEGLWWGSAVNPSPSFTATYIRPCKPCRDRRYGTTLCS